MKCLAIETTTEICSIALADESGIIAEYNAAHRMNLSQRLLPNIIAMLKDCGLEMRDIEGIGVSLGPGSFTGLRIGSVTAKSLADVLDMPIVGIVSLDLLALQFDFLSDALVCPIIKVRKGEVYYAFYRTGGGTISRVSEYEAGTISELAENAPEGDIIFCGDALADNLPELQERIGDRVIPTDQRFSYPKASTLAKLSIEKITAGEASDVLTLVPFYIRRSAPEMLAECKK